MLLSIAYQVPTPLTRCFSIALYLSSLTLVALALLASHRVSIVHTQAEGFYHAIEIYLFRFARCCAVLSSRLRFGPFSSSTGPKDSAGSVIAIRTCRCFVVDASIKRGSVPNLEEMGVGTNWPAMKVIKEKTAILEELGEKPCGVGSCHFRLHRLSTAHCRL